tara:strand:+ start:1659 stop:2234 length:576 start_codon:yes stop_codon:yes gene_type:complete
MADLFESGETVNSEEVKVIDNEVEHEMGKGIAQEDEPINKKVKKPRKPLSDERKAQLREQLKKGRETSLAKRQQGKKKKELASVKQEDIKEYKAIETPRISNYEREQELEARLTERITKKLKKQQEDEKRDKELIELRKQVELMKKPIGIAPIKEEKPKPVEKPAEPVRPARPVYSKFSPHQNHFMGGNFF